MQYKEIIESWEIYQGFVGSDVTSREEIYWSPIIQRTRIESPLGGSSVRLTVWVSVFAHDSVLSDVLNILFFLRLSGVDRVLYDRQFQKMQQVECFFRRISQHLTPPDKHTDPSIEDRSDLIREHGFFKGLQLEPCCYYRNPLYKYIWYICACTHKILMQIFFQARLHFYLFTLFTACILWFSGKPAQKYIPSVCLSAKSKTANLV